MDRDRSSILILNNDTLLLICDALRIKPSPLLEGQWRYHDPNPLAGLAALSATCKRLRALACPSLFRRVKLGRGHWTWDDIRRALTLPPPTRHIQYFTLDIFVHHKDDTKPEVDLDLATALARFLQSLPKLLVVSFSIPEQCVQLFQEAFEAATVELPTVRTLATDCRTQWFVGHCPALDVLSISAAGEWKVGGYFEALSRTTRLKHLEVKARWTVDDLKAIRDDAPGLRVLAMVQGTPNYGDPFGKMIPVISTFDDLEVLAVAPLGALRISGFRGGPRCGNAYHGPDGKALRASVAEERMQLSEKLATTVFGACAKLREFWISEFMKCTVTRTDDGSVSQVQMSKERRLIPTDALA